MVEAGRLPEQEARIRSLYMPCCVLEQDTLLSENIGNTPEAINTPEAMARLKVFIWDVKPQHKHTKTTVF